MFSGSPFENVRAKKQQQQLGEAYESPDSEALEDDHAETDAELLRVFRAVEGVLPPRKRAR